MTPKCRVALNMTNLFVLMYKGVYVRVWDICFKNVLWKCVCNLRWFHCLSRPKTTCFQPLSATSLVCASIARVHMILLCLWPCTLMKAYQQLIVKSLNAQTVGSAWPTHPIWASGPVQNAFVDRQILIIERSSVRLHSHAQRLFVFRATLLTCMWIQGTSRRERQRVRLASALLVRFP